MRRTGLLLIIFVLFVGQMSVFGQPVPENTNIVVANEGQINSKKLEFSPAFYEDGLVFITSISPGVKYNVTDGRIGQNIMSIYYAERDTNGFLKKPALFHQNLLTVYHEGPLTFNRTGEVMYFTRNNLDGKGKLERSQKDGIAKLAIYESMNEGEGWSKGKKLSFCEPESNYGHPSIGVEDEVLYFTSDREGGYGGMDIYMVRKVGDEWGDPINMGEQINTPANEIFPYIHADGTLYFASKGHDGLGGLDLFYCKNIGGVWQSPINLEKPFNSPHDDFGLIVDRDKKNGYFSSNRPGGTGADDIYNFFASGKGLEAEEYTRDVLVIVTDKESGDRLADVRLTPLNLDKLSMSNAIVDDQGNIIRLLPEENKGEIIVKLDVDKGVPEGYTNVNGEYSIKDLPYDNFVIKARKKGYITNELVIEDGETEDVFYMAMEKADKKIPLTGTVKNSQYGAPLAGATVTIVDMETGEETSVTTDKDGKFTHYLDYDKKYAIRTEKGNFISDVKTISTEGMDPSNPPGPMEYDVEMVSSEEAPLLAQGTIIELPSIYYNFNDASIRPDARKDLNALVSILNTFNSMSIELLSHTDSRGSKEYNKKLSQRRAQNAVNFLMDRGINKSRLIPIGYGETQPRNNCVDGVECTEEEHQFNRRTEFRVKSIDADVTIKYPENKPEVIDYAYGGKKVIEKHKDEEPEIMTPEEQTAPKGEMPEDDDEMMEEKYMVISGTFSKQNNAEARLQKIQTLGYSDAYLITFKDTNFKAIVVGTFKDKNNATVLETEIESQHDIESYIRMIDRREFF